MRIVRLSGPKDCVSPVMALRSAELLPASARASEVELAANAQVESSKTGTRARSRLLALLCDGRIALCEGGRGEERDFLCLSILATPHKRTALFAPSVARQPAHDKMQAAAPRQAGWISTQEESDPSRPSLSSPHVSLRLDRGSVVGGTACEGAAEERGVHRGLSGTMGWSRRVARGRCEVIYRCSCSALEDALLTNKLHIDTRERAQPLLPPHAPPPGLYSSSSTKIWP